MSLFKIKSFQVNPLQENCYVVSDETGEAVIIDCGVFFQEERTALVSYIREEHLRPTHLLCTHGHFDHVFGADTIFATFGLRPELHAADEFLYLAASEQATNMMGIVNQLRLPPIGRFLNDSDTITFGSHQLEVLHTPGHSPGGIIFYCKAEGVAFSGDTLFRMSVGRTDLPGGSWSQLLESLQTVVATLPTDTVVYCGHGPKTTIGDELRMNPYFR